MFKGLKIHCTFRYFCPVFKTELDLMTNGVYPNLFSSDPMTCYKCFALSTNGIMLKEEKEQKWEHGRTIVISGASLIYRSTGKQFTCNWGDPSLIPGFGSSPGEGIGYSLHYSWAFLVDQMVKNLSAIRETWVWSLGWEDALEEGVATHSSILAWRISIDRGAWKAEVHGVAESQTQPSD